jgi:nucleotide-binding universal stress UspA family protein
MFNKILVPLDGSEAALEVLPVVQRLIEGTGAEVTLFTAEQPPKATTTRRGRAVGLPVPVPSMPGSPVQGVMALVPPLAENRDQAVERREHEPRQLAGRPPISQAGGAFRRLSISASRWLR